MRSEIWNVPALLARIDAVAANMKAVPRMEPKTVEDRARFDLHVGAVRAWIMSRREALPQ